MVAATVTPTSAATASGQERLQGLTDLLPDWIARCRTLWRPHNAKAVMAKMLYAVGRWISRHHSGTLAGWAKLRVGTVAGVAVFGAMG